MRIRVWALRAVFLLLSGVCFLLAMAGVFEAQAGYAFKQGEYAKSVTLAKKSLIYNRNRFETLYLAGMGYWQEWQKTKDGETLSLALGAFNQLTHHHPRFAKGWFYKALAEKNIFLSQGELLLPQRLKVNQLLEKAVSLEPQSPWMVIQTSLEKLEGLTPTYSAEPNRALFKQLRWGLRQHYLSQASPYLEEVYHRLTDMGYGPDDLQWVTPKEAPSYFRLLEFYKRIRAYGAYSGLEPRYDLLRRKQASRLCDQADGWLNQGLVQRAEAAYRAALKMVPISARARAGQLAATLGSSAAPPSANQFKTLESLLIQEEEDLNFYWNYLEAGILDGQSAFLKGLLHYRQGRFSAAAQSLKQAGTNEAEKTRRFLAQTYIEMDLPEQAWSLLAPLLDEEKPDFRELLLLQRLMEGEKDENEKQRVQTKLASSLTYKRSSRSWVSEAAKRAALLEEGDSSGTEVNFQPGRVKVKVLLKLASSAKGRLARLRVWEKDREQFSGAIAVRPYWQEHVLEFETTGGWRWVQIALEKETLLSQGKTSGAQLYLGSLQLEYPE